MASDPRPIRNGIFPPEFFLRNTLKVAQALLGAKLTTTIGGKITSGMIVEVEAYHGPKDQASHAYRGRTKRNEVMFWEGGHCYVYLIYGMHHCVNVVTGSEGEGSAVLIRALEPLDGLALMRRRRQVSNDRLLTNGPGKLCQALGIDLRAQGQDLRSSALIRLAPYLSVRSSDCVASERIGISRSQDLPWRFFIRGNPWVSI